MTILGQSVGFAEPLVLAALLLPLMLVLVVRYAHGRRVRARAILGGPPALRGPVRDRLRTSLASVVLVALVLAVMAAARPQWGQGEQEISQRGIDVVVALDVSRSMAAEDVAPSRAQASADGVAEMLTHLTGNRVGLVTFAGSAFERAPLTSDLRVIGTLTARAQAEAPLVRPGTNLAAALEAALRILNVEDRADAQAILLVSDGEDLDSNYESVLRRARDRDVRIYTVFAGTTNPTALPAASGGSDVSVAQPEVLEAIARETGGAVRDVDRIPGFAVDFRRLQQTQFEEATEFQPIERFTWFAAAALGLLVVVMLVGDGRAPRAPRVRGGVIMATLAALVAVLIAGCGTAAWRDVEAGNRAFEEGDIEGALAAYRRAGEQAPDTPAIQYNIANALHQLRRYEEAGISAGEALRAALEEEDAATAALAHYTIGNTAYQRDQLEAARNAYIAALRIDPEDRDAKANLELVLMLLAPPPDEEPEDPSAGEDGEGEGEGEPGEDEPGEGEGQPGDPEPSDGQPGDGEPGDGEQPGDGQQGGGQPGEPSPDGGQSGGPSASGTPPPGATLEDVQAALAEALGELGPEVSREEALRILELARRANELDPLPERPGGGTPPR